MSTTAWRFSGTEGADAAVLRLKQLDSQGVIEMQDVAVMRWPQYASGPQVQEHVTDEGSRASALAKRIKKAGIDSAMLDAVKDDMALGTSALVLLSADAALERGRERVRGAGHGTDAFGPVGPAGGSAEGRVQQSPAVSRPPEQARRRRSE